MKTRTLISLLAAGLVALSGMALVGCSQATSSSSTNYAGTATYYAAPIHQTGIVVAATVTTNSAGTVTSASIKEYMDPSSWVYSPSAGPAYTYNPTGGEVVRLHFAGHNTSATTLVAAQDYAFFIYESVPGAWYEFVPVVGTANPTGTETLAVLTTAKLQTLDQKLANYLYAKAYVAASEAVMASPTATDLTTVPSYAGVTPAATTDGITVSTANAATQITYRGAAAATTGTGTTLFDYATSLSTYPAATNAGGSLVKNSKTSNYFPMTASTLGYRNNYARLITYFTSNPKANYAGASQLSISKVVVDQTTVTSPVTVTAGVAKLNVPTLTLFAASSPLISSLSNTNLTSAKVDVQETASGTSKVWTLDGTVDALTGATYTDFPNYALALQNAYLFAIGESKSGDLRAVVAR
jgi:hypothetical protein